MGRAKRKCAFEYAQNAYIKIHPAHAQNLIQGFALRWHILVSNDPADAQADHSLPPICPKTCFHMDSLWLTWARTQ